MPIAKARRNAKRFSASLRDVKATDSSEGTDFGAVTDGASVSKTFSLPEVLVGDHVTVSFDTQTDGINYRGYVSAAATVKLVANGFKGAGATPNTATKFSILVERF